MHYIQRKKNYMNLKKKKNHIEGMIVPKYMEDRPMICVLFNSGKFNVNVQRIRRRHEFEANVSHPAINFEADMGEVGAI